MEISYNIVFAYAFISSNKRILSIKQIQKYINKINYLLKENYYIKNDNSSLETLLNNYSFIFKRKNNYIYLISTKDTLIRFFSNELNDELKEMFLTTNKVKKLKKR